MYEFGSGQKLSDLKCHNSRLDSVTRLDGRCIWKFDQSNHRKRLTMDAIDNEYCGVEGGVRSGTEQS